MKQSSGRDDISTRPPPQPVGILRRTSTGASKSNYRNGSSAASVNAIDDYDGATNNNDSSVRSGSFTPITDVNELADRLLKFKETFSGYNNNNANQNNQPHATTSEGNRRRPPPPPPPRSAPSGQQRSQPSQKGPGHRESHRRSSDKSWCSSADENSNSSYHSFPAEEEYVRRMAAIKLETSDASTGSASPVTELRTNERNNSSPSMAILPPPLSQNDEHNTNSRESSESVDDNKINSNISSFTPRPVRVSQFEDKWNAELNSGSEPRSPPALKPVMVMASSLSTTSPKNLTKSPLSTTSSSVPPNCDKRGKCRLHPQYKVYNKKLLGGYEFIMNCPICIAKLPSNSKSSSRRSRNRSRSGDNSDNATNNNSPSMSRRSSRGRGRSRSADRAPSAPNLEGGDIPNMSTSESGRMMRAGDANSLEREERRRGSGGERRLRSRTRSVDRNKDLNSSFSSNNSGHGGKSLTNKLGNIRDKITTNTPSLRRRRSLSLDERRERDRGQSKGNGMSPGRGPRTLDKGKRGKSRDRPSKMSTSYDERAKQKKKNEGSNAFVHESSQVKFDKKTGRCKKHPSIVLAKKSTFRAGSWEIIKKNGCPFCAEERGDSEPDNIGQGIDEATKRKMDSLLKGGQECSGDTSSPRLPNNGEPVRGKRVSRMLYTTPLGETGWYTGDVDTEGKPHGYGRMRYKTGHSYEGEWIHGLGEVHVENLNRMKGGFGSNKAAWQKSETAPSVRRAAATSSANGVSTSDASQMMSTNYMYQQQPPHQQQGYVIPQNQMQQTQLQAQWQQQQQAQMQQAWANMSPHERQIAMNQWYANNGMSTGQQSGYQMQGYPPM